MDGSSESKSCCGDKHNQQSECKREAGVDAHTCLTAAVQQALSLVEAEVAQTCEQPSNVFDYGEWLSHQEYYDDYKHCQHKFMRFPFVEKQSQLQQSEECAAESGRTSPTAVHDLLVASSAAELECSHDDCSNNNSSNSNNSSSCSRTAVVIEQQRTLGRGGIVWCAAYILADHVLRSYANLVQSSSTRILELGAGTGVTSVAIAANSNATVTVTDLEPLLPLIRRNRALNQAKLRGNEIFVEPLPWGELSAAVASHGPYDIILAADCVYADCTHELLPQTISMYAHEQTLFVMTCRVRLDEPVNQFEAAMRKYFRHVERTTPDSANRNPGVIVMTATGWIAPDSAAPVRAENGCEDSAEVCADSGRQ